MKTLHMTILKPPKILESLCITASGNILASGNLRFRVFKLQLKVLNNNAYYLYSV